MNKFVLFVLIVVLCFTATSAYAQNNQEQEIEVFYHTVERGQTVYSVAKMYEVSVEDVYRLNIGSEENIKAGDVLKIPQKKTVVKYEKSDSENKDAYIYHTIQAKETLFGVSRKYGVDGTHIIAANPGLSQETFAVGKTIRIPVDKKQLPVTEVIENKQGTRDVFYTVPPKETLYNICRMFKTSEKELLKLNPELAGGLRTGITIRIPLKISERDLPKETIPDAKTVNAMLETRQTPKLVAAAKVALLLPFEAEGQQTTSAGDRMTEYYEGLLLAIDSLRKQGYSTEIFVYDIGEGTNRLQKILQDERQKLEGVHLIIGGVSNEQIKMLASFAKSNRIKYVIPFTSKNDEVLDNAFIFQVNTPPNYLYANAAYAGANLFDKYNIIFLETNDQDSQIEFVKIFQQELKGRNISWKDAVYNAQTFDANIRALLSTDKPNVIVPVSNSLEALLKIKNVLRVIAETKPEYQLTLFGYPVWQRYSKECLNDFHILNTHLYSLFYADNISDGVKTFNNRYKSWYSKVPMSTFPKYALLGFDTGMFFFDAIQRYGAAFENHLSEIRYKSVQTGFNFERVNNWGGFINTNIYIIHYKKDYTILRSDFK